MLELLAEGRTNPQIAERLFISTKTASVHVSNILRKLEATNRGEAAAIAHRHGLAPSPDGTTRASRAALTLAPGAPTGLCSLPSVSSPARA